MFIFDILKNINMIIFNVFIANKLIDYNLLKINFAAYFVVYVA